jgi:hypothetical protein
VATELDELICSRCAGAAANDSGFCDRCLAEHHVERYNAQDAEDAARRREDWRRRTTGPGVSGSAIAARERQKRHRLLEAVRPKEPPPAWADPYELARKALGHLSRVRVFLLASSLTLEHLDAAAELVKQLATGPAPPKV